MLSSMIKEHQVKQNVRKEEQGKQMIWIAQILKKTIIYKKHFTTEIKRKEAIASSNELTQAIVDHLNVG